MLTAQRAYTMLGNQNLWETAAHCHRVLDEAEVPHAVCGGVAVCLHGYRRNTVDLDLIVRPDDAAAVQRALVDSGLSWNAGQREFHTDEGIAVQFLTSGDRAGEDSVVRLPEPTGELNVEVIEGLPVVRLSKLIEIKIACGTGNVRRTHKDLADVVELIVIRNLDGGFARFLHKSVRKTFRELVRNAHGEP